jgi:phytoene dehydrogenase-like protein
VSSPQVLIVGGGLAGLCCARSLRDAKISFQLLEASDEVGGRARTDAFDGFLLDRGFQVLLTAYPEAQSVLRYDQLRLARYEPGALVRFQGRFHRFADPWRRPKHLFSTAVSRVGSTLDKLRIARLVRRLCKSSLEQLYERPETTTVAALQREGFSSRIVDCFFRPFLGGVFLDPQLETSSRMFEFVFRMFALGEAAVPENGMGEIARQITRQLPEDGIRLNAQVKSVNENSVTLVSGEHLQADSVVVACERPAAARLLGDSETDGEQALGQGVTCLYFAADEPPLKEPILVLNGEGEGPINNLCVPSQVSSQYAPPGKSLISVTVLGVDQPAEELLLRSVLEQLTDWFGRSVDSWKHLRSYVIPYALPNQFPPRLSPVSKTNIRSDGIFVCGDYLDTASIQGAMVSGRRAAENLIAATKS